MPRKFVFIDQKSGIKYSAQISQEPVCTSCPQEVFIGFAPLRFKEKFNPERLVLEIYCARCGSLLGEIPLEETGAGNGIS